MTNSLYIVDDKADILFFLNHWFKKQGYQVKTFSNSIDLLVSYQLCKPDLILLDVNLKGEDGRQICKMIKKKLHFGSPILLFSANPANGENFEQWDAAGFIDKPFNLPDISRIVSSHLIKE